MIKRVCVILVLLLLCGCGKVDISEYEKVSKLAVSMLKNEAYDTSDLSEKQMELLNNFKVDLLNPLINVSDFIVYEDYYKTNDKNTDGIFLEDNICYIRYNVIDFLDALADEGEPIARVVCNGYYTVLYHESVKPIGDSLYEDNYRYLGYYYDDGYNFCYRSYLDGNGLVIKISDRINIEFMNVDDLKLERYDSDNNSYLRVIIGGVIFLVVVGVLMFIKKLSLNS